MSLRAWPALVAMAVPLAVIAPIVMRVSATRRQPGGPLAKVGVLTVEAPVAGATEPSLATR
jgi:hypothetical protein